MYKEIKKSNRNSFFALINVVFPEIVKGENSFRLGLVGGSNRSDEDKIKENEWMQEYYVIYNSYILDSND